MSFCLLCNAETQKNICEKCESLQAIEKACKMLLASSAHNPKPNEVKESGSARALRVIAITEEFPEYDLSYFRVKAFSRLNSEYRKNVVKEGTIYAKTHKTPERVISVLRDVANAYIGLYDFRNALLVCNKLINVYADSFSYYIKAEALLKTWQIDEALICLKKGIIGVELLKKRGKVDNRICDRHIAAVKKRLHDYSNKKNNDYYYYPESEEAKDKLIEYFKENHIEYEHKLFKCDTSFRIKSFVAVDLETTPNQGRDIVIEIGAVKVENGVVVQRFSKLVNPHAPIIKRVSELTGINDDMVNNADDINSVFPQFLEFWNGLPLLAHNTGFDIRLLSVETQKYGVKIKAPVIDTVTLSKLLYPQLGKYNLAFLCEQFGIELANAHRAMCDAEAAAKLYLEFSRRYNNAADSNDLSSL